MKKLLLALSILAATACALSAADASAADAGSASFALSGAVDPGVLCDVLDDTCNFIADPGLLALHDVLFLPSRH